MRKIVFMRGVPGSGKSTFVRLAGLNGWRLSADVIRGVLGSATLSREGKMTVDQSRNDRVFELLNAVAEERMARGETLVVDNMFESPRDFLPWLDRIKKHRYEAAFVDLSGVPVDEAIARDAARPEITRVGEYRIRKAFRRMSEPVPPEWGIKRIAWSPDDAHFDELRRWLSVPIMDFSRYASVVHIGDIQGCFTVLAGLGGPLAEGFRDDTAYVFVGDLLDRGIENDKVMDWFLRNAVHRDNVFLLWGNHEDHINRYALGEDPVSSEFRDRTLPQLERAGIRPEHAEEVVRKAREVLIYDYRGKKVMVSHAGLSTVPERPELISLRQYSRGTGFWEDPVDEQFERNAPEGWTQIHGHRNHGQVDVQATERSFNLEGAVEFGGCLRTATLKPDGWTARVYRNPVFRPIRERLEIDRTGKQAMRSHRGMPSWMVEPPADLRLDENTLASMRRHEGVRERSSDRFPHVSSLNFTRKVFYTANWDDVVVKARGLFFNNVTREIVSRGYEKFFNIGETEATTLEALERNFRFPVTLYVKENGFLGNLGYDRQTDSLFVASKSTPEGPFADMFREILTHTLDETRLDALRRYLRDMEACMTFEVIDPVRDPHMIEYDRPKIVLLDILRRSADFRPADFPVVEAVAGSFGLKHKEKAQTFRNWESFEGWFRAATNGLDYTFGGRHVEGMVVVDANKRMTKVKFPYYSFWKQMRSLKDRIRLAREKGEEFNYIHTRRADRSTPGEEEIALAHAFRDWCLEQDNATLAADIITLRRAFERREVTCEPAVPSI